MTSFFLFLFIFGLVQLGLAELPIIAYGDRIHKNLSEQESAVSSVTLKDSAIIHDRDSLYQSLNLSLSSAGISDFSLRGLNNESVFGAYGTRSNSLIATLVNGVPLSASNLTFFPRQLSNTEQFTVLKGGQSTAYGVNALAGIVAYQEVAPNFDNSGGINLEISQYNTYEGNISQNIKLSESLALRLHYGHQETDGFYENITTESDEWGKEEREFFQAQLLWNTNDNLSLHLTGEYETLNDSYPLASAKELDGYSFTDRKTDFNTRNLYDANRTLLGLTTEYLSDESWSVKSILGYTGLYISGVADLDRGNLQDFFSNNVIDESHWSHDLSINGEYNDHNWILGTYWQNSDYKIGTDGELGIPATLPFPPFFTVIDTTFDSSSREEAEIYSLYGKFDYKVSDEWSITSGLRLNYERRELSTNFIANSVFSPIPTSLESTSETDHTALLPTLSVLWNPLEEWNFVAKYSRNFRSGGVAFAPTLAITQSYDSEFSNDYEIIARYNNPEDLSASLSIFFSDMDDMQVPYAVAGGIPEFDTLISNAGTSIRYGMELNIEKKIVDNLSVVANMTYLETEFESFSFNGVDLSGSEFPNAPTFASYLALKYHPAEGLFSEISWAWMDASYTQVNTPDTTSLGVRSQIDALLGYRKEAHSVSLFVRNVFDNDYAVAKTDFSSVGAGVLANINSPRTTGVSYSYEW